MSHGLNTKETGEISSCMSGEVMNTVKNRQNEYTVRILHADGYESVYSGLSAVRVEEGEYVHAGSAVGTVPKAQRRLNCGKTGLSVMPVFGRLIHAESTELVLRLFSI